MKLEANTPQTIQPFLEVFQTIPVSNESIAMLSAVQNKIRLNSKDVKMELATVHMPIKLFAIPSVLTITVSTM